MATCTVTGQWVLADGTVPSGAVTFTAQPVNGARPAIVATLDTTGTITLDVPASDDPIESYWVDVRLDGAARYGFAISAPGGDTLDLTTVTPAVEV